MNDYYHIGLVDEDTRYVLNAKSTADGFKRSPLSENWDCVAYLKAVDYMETTEGVPMDTYSAVVTAPPGGFVRMRKMPTTDSDTIIKLPVGKTVTVREEAAGWAQIEYDGLVGYMMDQYLQAESTEPEQTESELVTLTLPRSVADALFNALVKAGWG